MSQKNAIKPWLKQMSCVPPRQSASFVCCMEDVLAVYHRPPDPKRPVVALDEKPVQLLGEVREPLPTRPKGVAKQDHEYKRNGTANVFCAFEPLGNWQQLRVTERRTKPDFARFVKGLLDGRYKDAEKVVLVMDQLNTHNASSFYEAFAPEEARRLAAKVEIHHTPKHGSWPNVAEIELSVLGRRLATRVGDRTRLAGVCGAVEHERNESRATVQWQFTAADARVRLRGLYPSTEVW